MEEVKHCNITEQLITPEEVHISKLPLIVRLYLLNPQLDQTGELSLHRRFCNTIPQVLCTDRRGCLRGLPVCDPPCAPPEYEDQVVKVHPHLRHHLPCLPMQHDTFMDLFLHYQPFLSFPSIYLYYVPLSCHHPSLSSADIPSYPSYFLSDSNHEFSFCSRR